MSRDAPLEWTPERIASATGGAWLTPPADRAPVRGFSIDTRTLSPGEAFVAIRGERFDGNAFLDAAARAGARLAIVDGPDAPTAAGLPTLLVERSRSALADLARVHRASFPGRVVGVTGSNGKTTTVRLIHAALGAAMTGRASPKSFNNDLGVPLSVLGARASDRYLVCEVGINAPGEMALLADIVRPDVGVITSVGRAHAGGLGGVGGVAREKAKLLDRVGPDGVMLTPWPLGPLADHLPAHPRRVGVGDAPGAGLRIVGVEDGPAGCSLTLEDGARFATRLLGRHNAVNAAFAVGVARELGVADDAIREGLATVEPPPMRLELARAHGVTILNDAYNASPESMLGAIDCVARVGAGAARRCVALGDMLELGDDAAAAHEEALHRAEAVLRPDLFLLFGPSFAGAAARLGLGAERVHAWPQPDDWSMGRAAALLRPGDVVLIKGSRAVRLERLAAALEAEADADARRAHGPAAIG